MKEERKLKENYERKSSIRRLRGLPRSVSEIVEEDSRILNVRRQRARFHVERMAGDLCGAN